MRASGGAMRASSFCLRIIAHGIAMSQPVASAAVSFAAGTTPDRDASCRIPFETLKDPKTGQSFPLSAALNENAKLPENLRHRYIVADLNSADEHGYCRGIAEHFTPVGELSEFRGCERLRPRARWMSPHRRALPSSCSHSNLSSGPPRRPRAGVRGPQELSPAGPALQDRTLDQACRVRRVLRGADAQPVRDRQRTAQARLSLRDIFEQSGRRSSTATTRPSTSSNRAAGARIADTRLPTRAATLAWAAGSAGTVPFENGGNPIEMPNFLHFLPMPGYMGQTANGIHQIAGGLDFGGTFGLRRVPAICLGRFQAKVARWWTPTQAKVFMHFEPNRYRKFGIASTGKALAASSLQPWRKPSPPRPRSRRHLARNRAVPRARERPSRMRRSAFFRSPRSSRTDPGASHAGKTPRRNKCAECFSAGRDPVVSLLAKQEAVHGPSAHPERSKGDDG